jgi:hypothetical protein
MLVDVVDGEAATSDAEVEVDMSRLYRPRRQAVNMMPGCGVE